MSRTKFQSGIIEEVVGPDEREPKRAVSVVIPALNEAPHVAEEIAAVRRALRNSGWRFEVILVDDGSTDGTAEAAAETGARVVRHKHNRGYGAAIKRGAENALYDWIMIIDADGTYPSEEIPRLLNTASENDMVVGARIGENVKIPLLRRPAKWLLGALANYLARQYIPDLNSGFRLIRKELIERYIHLLPSGFSLTTTLTLAAACNDHEVEYVTIDYNARLGKSKIRARHAYDFMLLILRTIMLFNPLRVFIPLGAVVALGGLVKLIYDVSQNDLSESAILAMLSALIIWSVGLLADQNARIGAHR